MMRRRFAACRLIVFAKQIRDVVVFLCRHLHESLVRRLQRLPDLLKIQLLLQHPFNGHFSRTTWINQFQKGKTSLDLKDMMGFGVQWHQLDHMQTICTSLQTDNHASTPPISFFTGRMPFLPPNQQHQRTEGTYTT